ncbi:MAG: winged helix-turn-helix transcriptional regulator [Thermoplasmatota archaeon]
MRRLGFPGQLRENAVIAPRWVFALLVCLTLGLGAAAGPAHALTAPNPAPPSGALAPGSPTSPGASMPDGAATANGASNSTGAAGSGSTLRIALPATFAGTTIANSPQGTAEFEGDPTSFAYTSGPLTIQTYSCSMYYQCTTQNAATLENGTISLRNPTSGMEVFAQGMDAVLSQNVGRIDEASSSNSNNPPAGVGFISPSSPLVFNSADTNADSFAATLDGVVAVYLTGVDVHYSGWNGARMQSNDVSVTGSGNGFPFNPNPSWIIVKGTGAQFSATGPGVGVLDAGSQPTILANSAQLYDDQGQAHSFTKPTAFHIESLESGSNYGGTEGFVTMWTESATPTEAAALAPASTQNDRTGPAGTAATVAIGIGGLAGLGVVAWYWPRLRFAGTALVLPLYSRIQRESVMDQSTRERIYGIIREDPGVHAHQISSRAGVGWGTTVYHLKLLEDHRLVVGERQGRYKRFFPSAGYVGVKSAMGALRNETSSAVAAFVAEHPGTSQREVCEALNISASLVSWHVDRLEQAGLLKRVREGRSVRYFAGPSWSLVQEPGAPAAGAIPLESAPVTNN